MARSTARREARERPVGERKRGFSRSDQNTMRVFQSAGSEEQVRQPGPSPAFPFVGWAGRSWTGWGVGAGGEAGGAGAGGEAGGKEVVEVVEVVVLVEVVVEVVVVAVATAAPPASSLASWSSGAPWVRRWSPTARRLRNTRIAGLGGIEKVINQHKSAWAECLY
jgi:hypothetical protein